MRLDELLRGLPVGGGAPASVAGAETVQAVGTVEIRGLAYDSRRVEPGDLFVAWAGQHHDGRAFAAEAVGRGAAAVVAFGPSPAPTGVPWLVTEDPRALLGHLAARFYGHPDRELVLAGVTGTNGKSTVTALLQAILDAAGRPAGILGTLGYRFRDRAFGGERTTPEAADLLRTLREMRELGAQAVAMEVSSHALAQGRVAGVEFDLGVFTNLTRDHFDFHPSFADYFAAKRRLFAQLKPGGRAVVNADDPYGRRLLAELPGALGYGEGGAVRAREVELDRAGIRGILATPRGELPFASRLRGRFNLENLLAAAAGGEALGLPPDAIVRGIAARGPLPGRLEPVEAGQPFPVAIDFAHTDAALGAALRSFREATGRRLLAVFGCGGDRDPGKRPLMGRVAGELADVPIATSDNPRSEDPQRILQAVEEGLKLSGNREYRVVPDRREAIRGALQVAAGSPGEWAVLVAGKGHEQAQIVGERRIPFSDRQEILAALAALGWSAPPPAAPPPAGS
jgi:UDP-N-acetylmuramoyl-L-alanyl-D-glutamate--2,6-diaminopimelate ligase